MFSVWSSVSRTFKDTYFNSSSLSVVSPCGGNPKYETAASDAVLREGGEGCRAEMGTREGVGMFPRSPGP